MPPLWNRLNMFAKAIYITVFIVAPITGVVSFFYGVIYRSNFFVISSLFLIGIPAILEVKR